MFCVECDLNNTFSRDIKVVPFYFLIIFIICFRLFNMAQVYSISTY